MDNPIVTIIIPCYNHEKFVLDCLKSIINQTYSNIEVLIYDDCSSDNSIEIIRKMLPKLKEKFSYVEFFKNPQNLKVTKTINQGIRIAKGKYIKLLASDDLLGPNCIENLVNYMEVNTDCDIVFTNGYYIPEDAKYPNIMEQKLRQFYRKNPMPNKELFEKLYWNDFIVTTGVFICMKTYEKYGLYDESIPIEDWEYFLRVAHKGKIDYMDDKVVYYRTVGTSISTLTNTGNIEERFDYMYDSTILILKKYKIHVDENYYKEKMLQTFGGYLEKAMVLQLDKKVTKIIENIKEHGFLMPWKWKVKHKLYKLGILKHIINIWRRVKK